MSRHKSTGNIYFVLYLAVILELLLIIVERDEAEDKLIKRDRESREIIQEILMQMQVGAGNATVTSRITDEVALVSAEAVAASGIPYQQHRVYNVEIGVSDGATLMKESEEDEVASPLRIKQLSNVQDIRYEIFSYPSNDADAPDYNAPEWKPLAASGLALNTDAMQSWSLPKYSIREGMNTLQTYAPPNTSPIQYNDTLTATVARQHGGKITARIFTAQFQPQEAGWYKLRISSETNRILGVSGDGSSDRASEEGEATVNIGAMSLSVPKIKKVQSILFKELDDFGVPSYQDFLDVRTQEQQKMLDKRFEDARFIIEEKISTKRERKTFLHKTALYNDLSKLLTPQMAHNFEQNQGAMEILVRVTKPPIAIVQPYISLPSEVYTFDNLKAAFPFSVGPLYGDAVPKVEILGAQGKRYAVSLQRRDILAARVADESTIVSDKGASVPFLASALDLIPVGTYTIRVSHTVQGIDRSEEGLLRVFPARLKNRTSVAGRMQWLYYGSTLVINAEPDCESVIPANQFRVYVGYDPNSLTATQGLSARLPVIAKTKKVFAKVTWISPTTKEESELLPLTEGIPQQREPDIDLSRAFIYKVSGNLDRMTVEVRGMSITPSTVDAGGKSGAQTDISSVLISQESITSDPAGFTLQNSKLLDMGDGQYAAMFTIEGFVKKLKEPLEVNGTLSFTVTAQMRNPVNGIPSRTARWEYSSPYTYTIQPPRKGKR